MKFRHKIRDALTNIRDFYYKKILNKPRIYYKNERIPKSFNKIKYSKSKNLKIFFKIRPNSEDKIEKLKKHISRISKINL